MISEFRGDYFFLSNFYPCKITSMKYDSLVFESAEAAFQSAKTTDEATARKFAGIEPGASKSLGRSIRLRSDWEDIKLDVMRAVIKAKFTENSNLAKHLLNTGHHQLVEGNTWGDRTWGAVWNHHTQAWEGANYLGTILMEQRNTLRAQHV